MRCADRNLDHCAAAHLASLQDGDALRPLGNVIAVMLPVGELESISSRS
jgi:hypothetical protein